MLRPLLLPLGHRGEPELVEGVWLQPLLPCLAAWLHVGRSEPAHTLACCMLLLLLQIYGSGGLQRVCGRFYGLSFLFLASWQTLGLVPLFNRCSFTFGGLSSDI